MRSQTHARSPFFSFHTCFFFAPTHALTHTPFFFTHLYPFCFLSLLSAIYIELYYVYAAVWGHYAYTLYGILFLVKNSILLIEVLVCVLGIH